jgi:hypothetical protein
MDGEVQTQKFDKAIVVAESQECGEIMGIILRRVDHWQFTLTENIAVDATSNIG